jgi:hypothetical protein
MPQHLQRLRAIARHLRVHVARTVLGSQAEIELGEDELRLGAAMIGEGIALCVRGMTRVAEARVRLADPPRPTTAAVD